MLARIHASVERERTFVSDASHELRTPLAVLRTELELIGRERPTGGALQTAISSAIEETDRLSQLADDLLLLARADDNQLAIDPSPPGCLRAPASGRRPCTPAAKRRPQTDRPSTRQTTLTSSPIKTVPAKPSTTSSRTPCATRTRTSISAHAENGAVVAAACDRRRPRLPTRLPTPRVETLRPRRHRAHRRRLWPGTRDRANDRRSARRSSPRNERCGRRRRRLDHVADRTAS